MLHGKNPNLTFLVKLSLIEDKYTFMDETTVYSLLLVKNNRAAGAAEVNMAQILHGDTDYSNSIFS
jgi:hypothetical protein